MNEQEDPIMSQLLSKKLAALQTLFAERVDIIAQENNNCDLLCLLIACLEGQECAFELE